jgi:hypothetical protein
MSRPLTRLDILPFQTPDEMKHFWPKFWWKVVVIDNDCWEYQNGERISRLAWEIVYGEIPPSLCVCHSCDYPKCVNPNHLWLGTIQDNMADRAAKGRIPEKYRTSWMRTLERIASRK